MQRRTLIAAALAAPAGLRAAVPVENWDVLIAGAGTAGLAAAVAAREAGAERVLVLEASPMAGGHGIVSSGSVALARRSPSAADPQADLKAMTAEMLAVGGGLNDIALVRTFVRESEGAVAWLSGRPSQYSAHSTPPPPERAF